MAVTRLPRPVQQLLQWLRSFGRTSRHKEPSPKQSQQPHSQPTETTAPRYDVHDSSNQPVGQSDSLAEAHKQWQTQTGSQGRIIDTLTGEDVTPPPDDNGRYVVFDGQGQQLASFNDSSTAQEFWQDSTNGKGRIIDSQTGLDVTPKRGNYLTNQQLRGILRAAGKGVQENTDLPVDEDLVAKMLQMINRLPVPVFDISNIVGKGIDLPTRTVPIKRRKVTIEMLRKPVWVERPGPPKPSGKVEVQYPTDETELVRIRRPADLLRAARSQLGVPKELLRRRLVSRELLKRVYQEELPGEPTVAKRREWQEFEEPKVHEWTEDVEVTEEPKAQLLAIILDVSGSMEGDRINLAVALALAVVGAHLDDDSRYIYRQFATTVGAVTRANTKHEKQALAKTLMNQSNNLGGGTKILDAITAAATDVRAIARTGDRPEILLITDGDDYLTAEQIFQAIGQDVILHTTTIQGSNDSLRERSSTYYELYYRNGQVTGLTGK